MRELGLAGVLLFSVACGGHAETDATRRSDPLPSPQSPEIDAPDDDPEPGPSVPPEPDSEPPPYSPPSCPTTPPSAPLMECDPLALDSGCPGGQSCFPFVDYPTSPCEVERYGARCAPSGTGVQGDSCADSQCAADHICVSTGRGTLCARLCGLSGEAADVCDPGLLCLPIDIEGLGGCL